MSRRRRLPKLKNSPAWHEDLVVEVLGPALKGDLVAAWSVMSALQNKGYIIKRPVRKYSPCRWCGTKDRETRRDDALPSRKIRCRPCYLLIDSVVHEARNAARWRKLPVCELKLR